jgi:hypothetical protein
MPSNGKATSDKRASNGKPSNVGKGLSAILSGQSTESEAQSSEVAIQTQTPVLQGLNQDLLQQAVDEAIKYPKTTIFSPIAAAVFRYRWITTTRYSMSNEAREILERGLREKYPEIWSEVEKRLGNV